MKKHEELPQIEGYVPEKKTISILWANLLSLVLLVVSLGMGLILMYALHHEIAVDKFSHVFLQACVMMLIGIVVHELIHGVTWMLLVGKGFRHLSFGFMVGAVYCHIDVPMRKRQYVIGALMPLLLLGVIPWAAGIVAGSMLWMLFGAFLITGAMGDIMIVWVIRKEPAESLVYDHPSEAGCYVYRKVD